MSKLSAKKLLQLIERSEVVAPEAIRAAADRFFEEHGQAEPTDASAREEQARRLADWLTDEEQLITPWQRDQFLKGRYKGFFLKEYKLLGLIAIGGMAKVYLAEHRLIGRRVAVKVLPRKRLEQGSPLERFRREAQAVAAMDHPNVVKAYDIDTQEDTHYIVFEYVVGRDLQQWVEQDGPLSFVDAAHVIQQAAEGLGHAHQLNLIHRDIKPANLLIDEHGVVKVLDLGLARFDDDRHASLTMAHGDGVVGTADYLAPEQAIDSHHVSPSADLYGLGCSLYYALTGRAPFDDGTLARRILMHQKSDPRPIALERPDTPDFLSSLCLHLMAKKPENRPRSAYEVADVLAEWLVEEQGLPRESFEASKAIRKIVEPTESIESHVDGPPNESETLDREDTPLTGQNNWEDAFFDHGVLNTLEEENAPEPAAATPNARPPSATGEARHEITEPPYKEYLLPAVASGAGAIALIFFLWLIFG